MTLKPQSKIFFYLSLVVISITMLYSWYDASKYHFVPCVSECGETFISQFYLRNYHLYGFKYGLVEDHATSPNLLAHPYFYTHNLNIGGLTFTFAEILGLKTLWSKQLLTLFVFGISLFYGYRTVTFFTRSRFIGLVFLLLLCTDFALVLHFSLHALRVWHFLPLFALPFHVGRLSLSPQTNFWVDSVAIAVLAIFSFGIGYNEWIICFSIAFFTFVLCSPHSPLAKGNIKLLMLLIAFFSFPVILRQIQIAIFVGVDFWIRDFYYTFAIKVPFAKKIFNIPSLEVIDAYYAQQNVMRPPNAPTHSLSDLLAMLSSWRIYLREVAFPSVGLITSLLTILLSILAIISSVPYLLNLGRDADRERPTPISAGEFVAIKLPGQGLFLRLFPGANSINFSGTIKLMAAWCLGIFFGSLPTLPHNIPLYFMHLFPLIVAPVIFAKGLVLAIAILSLRQNSRLTLKRGLTFGIICILVADHIVLQAINKHAFKQMDVSWIPAVQNRQDATFAVSYISPSVAAFTRNWVVGVEQRWEREILTRLASGLPPFQYSDYRFFGERDVAVQGNTYLQPDYWLYFRIDHRLPVFALDAACRKEYITGFLEQLIHTNEKPTGKLEEVSPSVVKPGESVSFRGEVVSPNRFVQRMELVEGGKVVIPLVFNCIYGHFNGRLPIPETTPPGNHMFEVYAVYADGRRFSITTLEIKVDPNAIPSSNSTNETPWWVSFPQMNVREILSSYPNLPVVDYRLDDNDELGYLLIDLRPYYSKIK